LLLWGIVRGLLEVWLKLAPLFLPSLMLLLVLLLVQLLL